MTATTDEKKIFKAALIRKAQGILKTRIREAIAAYRSYQVFSANADQVSIRRMVAYGEMVTVGRRHETCTCRECQPDGIVTRQRKALLDAGIPMIDALIAEAWPNCHHQLIVAMWEQEYPELLDPMGEYGRTPDQVDRWRAGQYQQDAILQPDFYADRQTVSAAARKAEWA